MTRIEKESIVESLKESFSQAQALFLVNYKGLTVSQLQSFRGKLRQNNARMQITKARLMKIAAKNLDGLDGFCDTFHDQVGLVFAMGSDVPAVAKHIVDFAKQVETFTVVSGYFESKAIGKETVQSLASLPSKEILYAQLVGTLQSPIAGLVHTLSGAIAQLPATLQEVAKKKG